MIPVANIRHAIEAGMTPGTSEHIKTSLEAMGRQGILTRAHQAAQQGVRDVAGTMVTRRVWNRAEYGDDPNETGTVGADTADGGPKIELTPRGRIEMAEGTGGRAHVGGINERLGAMSQREETTSALGDVVGNVLGGKAGGPMKIPLWRGGWSRRRGGA